MKRIKQLSIWIIALFAITVTNPAWAVDSLPPRPGTYGPITSTQTTITVNWTEAADNVTWVGNLKYRVAWKKKKSATSWNYTGLKTNITTYTLTGLELNTEYVVEVWVTDENVNYISYGERTIKTKPVDTQYPTKGSYGTITSTTTTIAVNWTRGSDNVTPQNKLRYRLEWRK
ncbi:fibronectin type III domain-containing protein, partial [Tannerella forsythia]